MDAPLSPSAETPWPQLFAAWVESAPDGMLVADGESLSVLRANPACRRMLELLPQELAARNLVDVIQRLNPSLSLEDIQSLFDCAARGEAVQMLLAQPHLEISLRQHNAAGKPYLLLTLRDTSAQTELSQVMAEKEQALRNVVDQTLESLNLKTEFMGTMSHELRTPLNAIIGMTELLQSTRLNEPQREYAQIVHDAAQVLFTMINDMLDFSKIEAGRISLETTQFDPRSLTESTCETFSARARQKRLGFMTYIDPTIPRVLVGDPARLQQVLSNLISNAIKFTHEGQVVVRAYRQEGDDAHIQLKFEVEDTGIGISESVRPRMFQPFTQLDGSTTRKYGGTGLGLAISRSLVELMGGEIGMESELGEGSTFWFTASFERSELAELKSPAPALTDVRGLNILLVDDMAEHREILRVYLESWGMHCVETDNGVSALEILRAAARQDRPFDLALVDQDMPEMNGLQLGQQIFADRQLSGLRCIMLTGFDRLGQAQTAIQTGFAAYLTKPVKQSSLLDSILTVICGEGSLSPEPDPDTPAPPHPDGLILLVEDHSATRRLLLAQVQKLGYPAEAAANGAEAVQAIGSQP
ncbi:MAG TPA: ATP-binding protein, partial [Anaerolineaceae bacterium]|nr:ATP-binding protein [Anaerolineaceae bacterium]